MWKNHSKKNIVRIVLVITMLFLLTGCKKPDKSEDDNIKNEETVTDVVTEIPVETVEPTKELGEEVPTSTPTPTDEVTKEPEVTDIPNEEQPQGEQPQEEQATDNVENLTPDGDKITEDEAIQKVAAFSKEALGLEKELEEYMVEVDSWPTIVDGNESYCLNVFDLVGDKQQLVGVYYIAVDGSKLYTRNDEMGVFAEVVE